MKVKEFRSKISINSKLVIDGDEYTIRELVSFRFDDGSHYTKCYLNDNFVFADDLEQNLFLLVKPVKTDFEKPFLKKLTFDNKLFEFLYDAHAMAEETWGESLFPKGNSEHFWDYMAEDGSYLSLGIDDQTNEKVDFYGKIIKPSQIDLK